MQFVFDDGTTRREVEVVLHDPDAVVADLTSALAGKGCGGDLFVDGRRLPSDRRLSRAGIGHGSVVRRAAPSTMAIAADPPTNRSGCPPPVAVVDVVGGLDAGRWLKVPSGSWTIGRHGSDLTIEDPTVSVQHARLAVTADGAAVITDAQSLNGTWVNEEPTTGPAVVHPDDIVRLGASQLTVAPLAGEDHPRSVESGHPFSPGGTIPFNRPPRLIPSHEHDPLDPPREPAAARGATPVGIVAVVAPLVLGAVMVKMFHSWLYGMFAVLSPVMLMGGALESRRRNRRTGRRDRQRYDREVALFAQRLAAATARERTLRLERLPSVTDLLRRSTVPSRRLWERRPGHGDFLRLRAGLGSVPWEPPVRGERRSLDEPVRAAVNAAAVIAAAPVEIDLSGGGVVGVVGPRPAALGLARCLLVQAATTHGPADLPMAVLTAQDRIADWDWAKWLPHALDRSGSGERLLASHPEAADRLLRERLRLAPQEAARGDHGDEPPRGPTLLLVVDDESLTEGRRSPARSVLRGHAGPVAAIVVADREDRLPAVCTTVVEMVGGDGRAVVHRPPTGERFDDVMVCGTSDDTARSTARALARFDDPEHDGAGAGVPAAARLLALVGLDPPTPEGVLRCWQRFGADQALVVPLGVGQEGVVAIDLVRDGPHGLVAGTTGAGKSELLRTLVAGLAAGCPPDLVTFLLIDFKGGSAFDVCAQLPHTVGLLTDLDEHLGSRTLRCLEAELRHRERLLREAAADDLAAYHRLPGPSEPLPRLVVVVDEFATLVAELPDFVDALVGVAQRGRSLGVHLVLATQRPSGAVSENIRANANLRIALRVQDANDSRDIVDQPDAASISRNQPGRAVARLGPGEVVTLQVALSTGVVPAEGPSPVEVRPFRFPDAGTGPVPPTRAEAHASMVPDRDAARTDLSCLVAAIGHAAHHARLPAPRRPVPEPLAAEIDIDDVIAGWPCGGRFGDPGVLVPFAVADLPDSQSQGTAGWVPAQGNLLLIGVGGSGTTTALSSVALSLAATNPPDQLHLYVLDFGAGGLACLGRLAHTGAFIASDERERQQRLVRHLMAELARRRVLSHRRHLEPRVVVLLDGMAGFRSTWEETDPSGMLDDLVRLFSDGPDLGVHLVISAERAGNIPTSIFALARQRFVFRLADRLDHGAFGVPLRDVPDLPPGRAIVTDTGTVVQVGRPSPSLGEAVRRLAGPAGAVKCRPPTPIGELPTDVDPSELVEAARVGDHPWFLPLGIGDRTLGPVGVVLHEAEHAIVAGPRRSGRTTALHTLARVVRSASQAVTVVGMASARSALSTTPEVDRFLSPVADRSAIEAIGDIGGPVLLLVDDADLVHDEHGCLRALLDLRRPDLHVVASGRTDALRTSYGHWTRTVRASRAGVLLQPDLDLDGDLLGARLPRRPPVRLTRGRGFVAVDGDVEVIQVARITRIASEHIDT